MNLDTLYSYNTITSYTDFSIEDIRYVYEQLASKVYGIPYTVYKKWDKELHILRDYIIEKKFPYIDFLLVHFLRYKTDNDAVYRHPYLSAINNCPFKEGIYTDWVSNGRLGLRDFSAYFYDTSLINSAKTDASFLKRFKSGITKANILKQAENNNLHWVSYAYFMQMLRDHIELIHAAKISEIKRYIKKEPIWSKLVDIYGKVTE